MPREPGEPDVRIVMTPDGVRLKIDASVHGDGSDWPIDHAGTWMMEMWERTVNLARMHHDYGVEIEGFTSQREIPTLDVASALPAPPSPIPDEAPPPSFARQRAEEAEQERARLNDVIDRSEQNGTVLPVQPRYPLKHKKLYGAAAAELEEKLLTLLANAPRQRLTLPAIRERLSGYAEASINHRLRALKAEGKVEYRTGPGWTKAGGYALVQPAPREAEVEPAREDPHLLQVRAVCRGRVLLMIGGDPQRHTTAAKGLVETLELAQLRWPLFEEKDPIEKRLREIRRPDVDVVLINQYNRRYSREYQHAARDAGKVVIILEAGLGVNQIVEQLWQQFACRVEMKKFFQESNLSMLLTV